MQGKPTTIISITTPNTSTVDIHNNNKIIKITMVIIDEKLKLNELKRLMMNNLINIS